MTTPDKDPTGEEGKPNEESATKKRKEPPHHDYLEVVFDTDSSPERDASSNFLEISRSEKKRDREKKRRGGELHYRTGYGLYFEETIP